jgi:hypothetical protein
MLDGAAGNHRTCWMRQLGTKVAEPLTTYRALATQQVPHRVLRRTHGTGISWQSIWRRNARLAKINPPGTGQYWRAPRTTFITGQAGGLGSVHTASSRLCVPGTWVNRARLLNGDFLGCVDLGVLGKPCVSYNGRDRTRRKASKQPRKYQGCTEHYQLNFVMMDGNERVHGEMTKKV